MVSAKVNQLQILQQNVQAVLMQRQQLQSQLVELDSALTELRSAEKAYHIVGKVMLAASREELQKELQEKKELADIRVKNLVQQERNLKENLEKLQKEVIEELKEKKSSKER